MCSFSFLQALPTYLQCQSRAFGYGLATFTLSELWHSSVYRLENVPDKLFCIVSQSRLSHQSIDWLVDGWLIDWLAGRVIDLLIDRLIDCSIVRSIDWLICVFCSAASSWNVSFLFPFQALPWYILDKNSIRSACRILQNTFCSRRSPSLPWPAGPWPEEGHEIVS